MAWLINHRTPLKERRQLAFSNHLTVAQSSANHTHCSWTATRDWARHHSHNLHIPHRWSAGKNCSRNLASHWLGTIQSLLPVLCSLHYPNYFKLSYINTRTFNPLSFQYPQNSQRHPEDGGSTFLQNVGTLNHHTVQKPKEYHHIASFSLKWNRYPCILLVFTKKLCFLITVSMKNF
jgi:hypothetical protein